MSKDMNWIGSFLGQSIAIVIAIIILLEIIGLFVFDNRYYWNLRYLTYSDGAIANQTIRHSNGDSAVNLWTYAPDSTIRSIAVYADVFGATLEYDCAFHTNSLGFIKAGSPAKPVDYLVLGDSFTEGQGGCPWLTEDAIKSDEILSDFNILNGGLQGTGIKSFESVLELHEESALINNVVVIAISNDFKRGDPRVWPLDNSCYRSLECGKDDYWYFDKFNTSDAELIEQANIRRDDRKPGLKVEILRYSFTYRIIGEFSKIIQGLYSKSRIESEEKSAPFDSYSSNFAAFEKIIEKYPKAIVLLVPQRDEVGLFGRENMDTRIVKKYFNEKGISFENCDLSASDYMPIDGHPNVRGFSKLFSCLKNSITKYNL
ncbi:MAG: SGNH/GDSL hydrolase family protein [Candidatus Electrothrix sp. AR4]|nr:SGNH/GDSL hydrolase family protein [Candidatus Electrothrix sp. AR4]